MTIILNAALRNNDEPIAAPVFRADALLDGMLDVPAVREAALEMFDAFVLRFGCQVAFVARQKKGGSAAKLVKSSPPRIDELRHTLASGMADHSGLRLYGTDTTALGAPLQPSLFIMHEPWPATQIEMALDWDMPDLPDIIAGSDRIFRTAPMRAGYQAMGFQRSPVKWSDDSFFPPATDRFRTAVMGKFNAAPQFQAFVRENIVKMWGPYKAGIFATGWRTYVGAAFAGRLDTTASVLADLATQGARSMSCLR